MPADFLTSFRQLLEAADALRPGYWASLGSGASREAVAALLPESNFKPWLIDIYNLVNGTPADIRNQSLMDFVPGYRLVQAHESTATGDAENQRVVPLLSNYSSDHIAFVGDDPSLWRVSHDDSAIYKIYDAPENFIQTILECYRSGAYLLDADGYLDCDDDAVDEIAQRLNPDSDYWRQE